MLRTAAFAVALAAAASAHAAELETVATFGADTPPGNVAVGPDGRVFISLHNFYGPKFQIMEVAPDGAATPYPTAAWSGAPDGDGPGLQNVLGLKTSADGVLWMLDGASPDRAGRLVGWDTKAERLREIIYLAAPVTRESSFLNDLAIDDANDAIYVSDTGNGETSALIVVDLETGRARRVLEGSRFTRPEDVDMVIDGRVVTLGGAPARIGVNPIAIDATGEWVYFAPMSGRSFYRVRSADLRDETLDAAALEAKVERVGDKPLSDGSIVDAKGNVYVTSVTDESIGVLRPNGRYETLFQREDLSWPDGFALGPDGFVYVTINQLHRSPVLNDGQDGRKGDFQLLRFKAVD